MKRFLFFSVFIIISFNLFSQHLLDSLFESIKYPKVPENKSLVYFIRHSTISNVELNWIPICTSVVLPQDTILLSTLIGKNYNHVFMDPGEYQFLVSDIKEEINIKLEPGGKYYIKVAMDMYASYIHIIDIEKGDKSVSKLNLSTYPSWVAVFYNINRNTFSQSKAVKNRERFFNNFLEESKYIIGKLIGVSEESYFLDLNGKIIEVDNLECKSIYFFKDLPLRPTQIINNCDYRNHILFSSTNGEKIRDGLLFSGNKFLEHVYLFQTFFNYPENLYNNKNIIKINTNKDFLKIDSLLNN